MVQVKFEFGEDECEKIASGEKTCMCLLKKSCNPGDYFILYLTRKYIIGPIVRMTLVEAAHMLYKRDGHDTIKKFEEAWIRKHGEFDPHQEVVVHFFEEVIG